MDGIVIALIGAATSVLASLLALVGVIITTRRANEKVIQQFKEEVAVNQAVTNEKISELTREVRKHNNFAERIPVVENDISHIECDIRELRKFHEIG